MYSSTRKLFENFLNNQENQSKIVLYGLGKQTEEILSECFDSRIIGVLDGFRQDGTFYGKPVLSLDKLVNDNIKIIIIARSASERIIYKRICSVCEEKQIPVYNLQGELLRQEKVVCNHPYFRKNQEELLNKAAEYDAISFDIFDTLLIRKVSDREIFYQMIEQKYHATFPYAKWRMQAELELSRHSVPSIEDIYEWIHERTGIGQEELSVLLRGELEMEEKLLIQRRGMAEALHRLIHMGKAVYLISDMYLHREFIEKVLDDKGISGYKELYVSCEYETDKAGYLYDIYKDKSFGKRRLHIGDSNEADGACANRHGIDSYLIKPATEMAELTGIGQKLEQCGKAKGLRSMIYARLFNDPFALYNSNSKIIIKDAYLQGYAFLGPLLVGYVHWLYEKLKNQRIDCILFISRDGYLVQKIYDIYVKDKIAPQSLYFLTSRTLAVLTSIETSEDILYAMSLPFSGTPQDMLLQRFNLHLDEIKQRISGESEKKYILRHEELIKKRAAEARGSYKKYYEQFSLENKRIAIFDFVSTGTCHVCLEKILGFLMEGYYFEKLADTDERKKALNIYDFVHSQGAEVECDSYFLLETWIKATEPSVKGVLKNGQIVFGQNKISENQVRHINRIQEGAVNFCRDYLEMETLGLNEDIEGLALHMLPLLRDENVEMQLEHWKNYDEFSNRIIEWK